MRLVFVLTFLFNVCILNAQQLFYQNTFKGGVCGDGKSYLEKDYLWADTIKFANVVPFGSTIKKALLVSHKIVFLVGSNPTKEYKASFEYNNQLIDFDSTNNTGPFFNCDLFSNPSGKNWIVAKDVTSLTQSSNNTLVKRDQHPMPDTQFVYIGFYLLICYENPSMPETNVAIFLNTQSNHTSMLHNLVGMNRINTSQDVGLSIWTGNVSIDYPMQFNLSSSLGNYNLGTLMERNNPALGIPLHTLPGSFNYANNTLFGLSDDTPDAFIDSSDALANIKTYVANNTQNFNLTSNGTAQAACINVVKGFFLSYTTPCPARGFNDTIVKHTICQGQSVSLNTQSTGNTYSWYPTTGLTNANSATPIASPTTTTNYIVSIDSAGCKHTEQVQVAVTPIPQADTIFASNNVCGGPSGSIIVKPGHGPYEPYIYSLNNAAGISDTSFTNLSGGNYNVLITDTRGCTWQSNNFIIKDTIMVNATANAFPTSGVAPFTTQLSATATTGANNYNWYINNQYTSNAWYYNQTFGDSGTYNITLVAYNNIPTCADTTTLTIIVLPQDTAGIFIPNVFSPNGDGVNDVYELKIKNAELEVFEMYDRWGVLVSSALDLTKGNTGNVVYYTWSGRTTSGIECSAGTYFYVIKVKLDSAYSKEGTKEFKGFVTLVR